MSSFMLAQAMEDTPVAVPSVNPVNVTSLINMSAILVLVPLMILIALIAYIVLHSPIGAPVFKRQAEKAFQKISPSIPHANQENKMFLRKILVCIPTNQREDTNSSCHKTKRDTAYQSLNTDGLVAAIRFCQSYKNADNLTGHA